MKQTLADKLLKELRSTGVIHDNVFEDNKKMLRDTFEKAIESQEIECFDLLTAICKDPPTDRIFDDNQYLCIDLDTYTSAWNLIRAQDEEA